MQFSTSLRLEYIIPVLSKQNINTKTTNQVRKCKTTSKLSKPIKKKQTNKHHCVNKLRYSLLKQKVTPLSLIEL